MAKFTDHVDLDQNELQNAVLQPLTVAPADPKNGQIYYDETRGEILYWSVDHWAGTDGIDFRGAYDPGTDYTYNDVVSYDGATYVAIADAPAGTLPIDVTYWTELPGGGAAVAEPTYTNPVGMPQSLGGLPAGSTFDLQTMTQMFDRLLYPYQTPGFSGFSISGQTSPLEVGTPLSGSKTFNWSTTNAGNVKPNSVSIYDGPNTGSPQLATGLAASGSISATIASSTPVTPTTRSFFILGQNTQNNNLSAGYSVSWQWKRYYGTSTAATLTENEIEAMTGQLNTSGFATYSFAAGGFKYIAYPASFPAASGFKDTSTQLSVTMADPSDGYDQGAAGVNYVIQNITNVNGIALNYRVYRTKYQLGGSISIAVS